MTSALIITLWCGIQAPAHADSGGGRHPTLSFSAVNVSREHKYRVDARVRPFLFWIRKSNVGDGRITWRTGPDGSVGYELLVGTDPARTPRRINRWGYLREESAPLGGIVFGVMSQSEEQSIEDADKRTSGAAEVVHVFKALHQQATRSEARITVSTIQVAKDLTYADLGTLLSSVPAAPSKSKVLPIGASTSPGFLAATAALLEEGRAAAGRISTSAQVQRVYPYNGQLYRVQFRSAEVIDSFTQDTRELGPAIRGRFRIVNQNTGEETAFTIVYGIKDDLRGVPLFISFRPRWWLEIECVLTGPPAE